MQRRLQVMLTSFLIIIVLLPLAIDLFSNAGRIIIGESAHAWTPTVLAYLPLLVLVSIYLFAMLEPLSNFGIKWSSKWLWPSIALGVVSGAVIFGIDILTGTLDSFGVPSSVGVMTAIGFLVSWALLAPLVEELLFRGIMQTLLMRSISSSWKIHPAVLIAAGLEAAFHLSVPLAFAPKGAELAAIISTLPQAAYVLLFGAIGGYIYQRTGSLVGPFVLHAVGNAVELLLYWGLV